MKPLPSVGKAAARAYRGGGRGSGSGSGPGTGLGIGLGVWGSPGKGCVGGTGPGSEGSGRVGAAVCVCSSMEVFVMVHPVVLDGSLTRLLPALIRPKPC